MWNWFNCYLSGRHDYGVWCEPGAVFLRCVHCGKRSAGWSLASSEPALSVTTVNAIAPPVAKTSTKPAAKPSLPPRVLPFERATAQAGARH